MVVSSLFFDTYGTLTAVHQQEASRAVGVLNRTGFNTHLSEQCGLLVAGTSRYGHMVGKEGRCSVTVHLARRLHFGHHRQRNAKHIKQFLVPLESVDVEEHRA